MDFAILTFLKFLCIVTPARVVLDHGVLVHGGARARAPARVVPNHAWRSCAPWRAPARVVPNHGWRVSGVCQPCVRCVSASPKSKIRGQPETQDPPPARNQDGTPLPPRHPCCKKWYRAQFFHDASDEKPVSPCVARVIKFHFRRCSIRKACVGDPSYRL